MVLLFFCCVADYFLCAPLEEKGAVDPRKAVTSGHAASSSQVVATGPLMAEVILGPEVETKEAFKASVGWGEVQRAVTYTVMNCQ